MIRVPHRIFPKHRTVLTFLSECGEMTAREMGERTGLSLRHASQMLGWLRRFGLVDQRLIGRGTSMWLIEPKGEALLKKAGDQIP